MWSRIVCQMNPLRRWTLSEIGSPKFMAIDYRNKRKFVAYYNNKTERTSLSVLSHSFRWKFDQYNKIRNFHYCWWMDDGGGKLATTSTMERVPKMKLISLFPVGDLRSKFGNIFACHTMPRKVDRTGTNKSDEWKAFQISLTSFQRPNDEFFNFMITSTASKQNHAGRSILGRDMLTFQMFAFDIHENIQSDTNNYIC